MAVIGQPYRKSIERGVFRTKDAGKNWEKVFFLSDSVGAVDLEFAPDNPNVIYAAMWRAERKPWTIISGGATDGIYKSIDGGDNWTKMKNGLPTKLVGKIDFAVSPVKPARVWAQIQASDGHEGIYFSDDYAESWNKVEIPEKMNKSLMTRPYYFINITANPKNENHIWIGSLSLWTSYNAGKSWVRKKATHGDHHDLWINPIDTTIMINANDGGASVTRDGGKIWSTVYNQQTAELYSCHIDDQYPYYLYSGQQDNSTVRVPSQQPFYGIYGRRGNPDLNNMYFIENVGGCETGPVIAKPGSPHIIYANCKGRFSVYNKLTGIEQNYIVGAENLYGNHPDEMTYRFQRVTPMEVSPHDPNTIYYGSQFLHKTENGGKNWKVISPDLTENDPEFRMRSGGPINEDITGEEYYQVLYAIRESPIQKDLIWTGSNDGLFYVTKDGGKNWKNVSPDMPKGGRISNIEVSPHNPEKAYYAVYRDYLGDDHPYLYKTEDYGKTWSKIVNGIPSDYPTRVLREDPDRKGLLYAGTEFGLFISFDDGENWKPFQANLPVTPVTDIRIKRKDLALSTMGRSFWILDDISFLHSFNIEAKQEFQFYKPRDVIDYEQNIYFSLPDRPIELIVKTELLRGEKLIYSRKDSISKIPANEWGVRKIKLDLNYILKDSKEDFKGPNICPGEYSVNLSYGSSTQKQKFQFLLHPELKNSGTRLVDLREQEELALKVAELLLNIKNEIRNLESEIKRTKSEKKKAKLSAKLGILKKGSNPYDKPKLQEHTRYLYWISSADPQKLGDDIHNRYKQLQIAYNNYLKGK